MAKSDVIDEIGGNARNQLRAFIERIERLLEEKKTIADDVKDVFSEAKGSGFDTKTMKKVLAIRKMERQEYEEGQMMLDTYLAALNMLPPDTADDEEDEV